MKEMTGAELLKEMGISRSTLEQTFKEYNEAAKKPGSDKWGKKFYEALPAVVDDKFMVAQITPVIHYCMGGVASNKYGEVLTESGQPVPGLFVAGEALGGVHGVNRLGGSSLLDCVVFGRVSGRSASKHLMTKLITSGGGAAGGAAQGVNVRVTPGAKAVTLDISWDGKAAPAAAESSGPEADDKGDYEDDPNAAFYGQGTKKSSEGSGGGASSYSAEEVAKHNTDKDCWVILDGFVYDVTNFLDDHPGGKKAIMLYAGKDATKEFEMLHKPDILTKYAADFKLGPVAGSANL